jgi:hypothetical protein
MKRILMAFVFIAVSRAFVLAGEINSITASAAPAPAEKYKFTAYLLIKETMKKNYPKPDFGWRVLAAFPLRVREFTYASPFIDYSPAAFKNAENNVLSGIDEPRRKNAMRVSEAVFNYIDASITAREAPEEPAGSAHKAYMTALQVLKGGTGNSLEKCRLAVAFLRYFTIPARMVQWSDVYAVEYFLQPLDNKGRGRWYIRDFDGKNNDAPDHILPADWHPIDAKELLNVEWSGEMSIRRTGVKNEFLAPDEAPATGEYEAVSGGQKELTPTAAPESGDFFLLKKIEYELTLSPGTTGAQAIFTLPYRNPDNYNPENCKTVKYLVKSGGSRLEIRMKWPHTTIKPAQDGILYTLPVTFTIKAQ